MAVILSNLKFFRELDNDGKLSKCLLYQLIGVYQYSQFFDSFVKVYILQPM